MRKIKLVLFLTIITLFLGINNVYAQEKYQCYYKFELPDIIDSPKSDSYSFWVYVDPSTGKVTTSIDSTKFSDITNGWYIANDQSINKYYELSKTSETGCVHAFATVSDVDGQFQIYYGNMLPEKTTYPLTSTCFLAEGGFCDNSDKEVVEYCERSKTSRNNNYTWHFKFYSVNGTKKFKVWTTNGYESSAVESNIEDGVGVGVTHIQIDESVVDKLYSANCSGVPLYLECPYQDNVILTGTQPSPGNNCAYANTNDDNGGNAPSDGHETSELHYSEIEPNDPGSTEYTCEGLIGENVLNFLTVIFGLIRIVGPILALVLGMYDLFMAMVNGEDDAKKKALKKLKGRIIAAVLLLILPYILDILLHLVDKAGTNCIPH